MQGRHELHLKRAWISKAKTLRWLRTGRAAMIGTSPP